MSAQRDKTLDIAKAFCIILMVIGHSGCPTYLNYFLYMFHMPCFFFISGYLLNDKYLSNLKNGLLRKAKESYYPFVKWTLIFIVLHNLFALLSMYETSYTWSIFADRIVRAFTLRGSEQLLGGFWFLISLFWASVIVLLYLTMLTRVNKLTPFFSWGGCVCLLAIIYGLELLPIKLPMMFRESTLMATAFYLSGYNLKRNQGIRDKRCVALLLVPFVVAFNSQFSMGARGLDSVFYYIIAMSGTIGIIALSELMSKTEFRQMLSYIGEKTIYILVFHFLAFKLVSFLHIVYFQQPISYLSQFPVLTVSNTWLWIVYSLVGVMAPLIVEKLIRFTKSFFTKRAC